MTCKRILQFPSRKQGDISSGSLGKPASMAKVSISGSDDHSDKPVPPRGGGGGSDPDLDDDGAGGGSGGGHRDVPGSVASRGSNKKPKKTVPEIGTAEQFLTF